MKIVCAAAAEASESASASASASRHPAETRQWPWRLVVVDIYGRASRWAEAAESFDAFLGEVTFPPTPRVELLVGSTIHHRGEGAELGSQKAEARAKQKSFVRLPMPDDFDFDFDFDGGSGSVSNGGRCHGDNRSGTTRGLSVLPLASWACFHPSALMHAITAYLKLGRVEEAAEVLSFLKASVRTSVTSAAAGAGGINDVTEQSCHPSKHGGLGSRVVEDDGRRRGRDVASSDLPTGSVYCPDPAWIEGAVRGFARVGRWDLARVVISAEIMKWLSSEPGTSSKQSGSSGGGGGGGCGLTPVLVSLKSFLESKLEAKKQTPGQAAGSRACLELLKGIRASGWLNGGTGTASVAVAVAVDEGNMMVAPRGGARVRRPDEPEPGNRGELLRKPKGTYGRSVDQNQKEDQHRQATSSVYTEALRWLFPEEFRGADEDVTPAPETGSTRKGPSSHRPPASDNENFSSGIDCRSVLVSRCESVPPEAMIQAIQRAWSPDGHDRHSEEEDEEGAGDGATKERRRDAAFALYEAGVESKTLSSDAHWVSRSAGVLNLDCSDYKMHHGVPLAALNLVLNDMRQKYAYEESVSVWCCLQEEGGESCGGFLACTYDATNGTTAYLFYCLVRVGVENQAPTAVGRCFEPFVPGVGANLLPTMENPLLRWCRYHIILASFLPLSLLLH